MSREEYNVSVAPWRATALSPTLWFIEAYAAVPIVLWIIAIRWETFYLAVGLILLLSAIRVAGYDALSIYRSLQCLVIRALGGYMRL